MRKSIFLQEPESIVVRAMALVLLLSVVWSVRGMAGPAPEFKTTASGLKYSITVAGTGATPKAGQIVVAEYEGRLSDGRPIGSSKADGRPIAFRLGSGEVLKGWDEGFALLRVGDHARFVIPPELAGGMTERGDVPAGSVLEFDVEFKQIKDRFLSAVVQEAAKNGGASAARSAYQDFTQGKLPDVHADQGTLNSIGYEYMYIFNDLPMAIAVFDGNTRLFPKTPNSFDSLAEAYLQNGQRDLALVNYRKVLAMDPKFHSKAATIVQRLEHDPKSVAELEQLQLRVALSPDIETMERRLKTYLSRAPAEEHADSVKLVQEFFKLVQGEDSKKAEGIYRGFLDSLDDDVRKLADARLQELKTVAR